jgi:hypothetical protein
MDEEEQFEGQEFLLPEIFGEPREEDVEQEHDGSISFFALSKCICLSTSSDSLVTFCYVFESPATSLHLYRKEYNEPN